MHTEFLYWSPGPVSWTHQAFPMMVTTNAIGKQWASPVGWDASVGFGAEILDAIKNGDHFVDGFPFKLVGPNYLHRLKLGELYGRTI